MENFIFKYLRYVQEGPNSRKLGNRNPVFWEQKWQYWKPAGLCFTLRCTLRGWAGPSKVLRLPGLQLSSPVGANSTGCCNIIWLKEEGEVLINMHESSFFKGLWIEEREEKWRKTDKKPRTRLSRREWVNLQYWEELESVGCWLAVQFPFLLILESHCFRVDGAFSTEKRHVCPNSKATFIPQVLCCLGI